MIFIDEMKNMKIYKKQFFLPYLDKDKKHGSLVYLLSPNYASSRNLINSPMTINRRYFESYYFERNAAYYIKTGKVPQEELLEAVIEEQRDSAIHNGFDYEAFDEFLVSKEEPGETPTYYETIKACLLSNKLDDGDYNVYVHPVNHPEIATYIGKINVSVTSDAFYDAFYKWFDWEEIEDEGEYIEEGIDEAYYTYTEDMYYNRDKFESGEINLCFITGQSGSGKTTMANSFGSEKVEVYELDDLLWNKIHFTLDQMKEYGDLYYSYFTGRGKRFWYTPEDVRNGVAKSIENYDEVLFKDFMAYAKAYAKSHKNTKFILEGIQVVYFCKPEEFKDYAFYIKGTSAMISRWRAAKRDSKDAGNFFGSLKARIDNFTNSELWERACRFEQLLQSFRNYFDRLGAIWEQTDRDDNDYSLKILNRFNVSARDRSDNACVYVEGYAKPMRGRSSIIILKEIDGKLCAFCDFVKKTDGMAFSKPGDITLPGGGWDPNETPRDAAIREAGEETLMAVKDVMHCGYHIEYSDDVNRVAQWVKEHVPEDNWWYGYYSEVFVGMYDKPYSENIAPEDLDDIADRGDWVPVEEFVKHEPIDYVNAIKKYLEIKNTTLCESLIDSLLEISKADEEKNQKLEPVFIINTYTGSPFGKVIKSVTKNEFSHTLLSFTPSLRKMYTFDFGKKVIDDDLNTRTAKGFTVDNIDRLRAMNTQNMEVFVLMVPAKVKFGLEKSIDWYKANIDKTAYGFSNLFDYLRGSKKLDSFGELKMFCSEFVDLVLKTQNIDISGKTSRNAAPKDMGHYTDTNNIYPIFKGRAVDYNEEVTVTKIEELRTTIPYKKLNAVSKKYLREEDTGIVGSVDATDVQKQMKNLLRRLKMKSKRGIYKFNKDRRKADAQLPTASSIMASVNTGTPSTAQSESFIRSVISASQYEDINSFYLNEDTLLVFTEGEKRFDSPLRKLIWNDRLKANKEVLQVYNKVKADIPSIKYTYLTGDRYQARNLWYDLSFYTEVFFKNNTFKLDKAVDLYFDFLSRMLEPSRMPIGYTKRTIFIPVIDWNTNVSKKTWLYRDGINPISVMHRMMSKNMAKVKSVFKNMDIIFFGNGNYFKLNFSTLSPEEEKQLLNRFKIFINKMTSGATFTDDEVDPTPDNQESEKVIVTNVVDKIEKAQKINMNTQSAYISSAIVTAKAFTGSPVRPTVTNTSVAKKVTEPVIKTQKDEKERIKTDKKQAEKIVASTTTSNAVTTTAKKQKEIDTIADEENKKAIIDRISKAATNSVNTDDAIEHMEDDEAVKELIMKLAAEEDAGIKINRARMDRMAQLNAEFQDKEVRKGVKIKDILDPEYQKKAADEPLPSTTIKVDSPFADDWKDLKYINFDKTYDINEDIMKMLNALSEKQYPIAIRDVKIENTSTSEDYIDTYTIDMEDHRGKRFSIKMDIPKFKDHKYLILREKLKSKPQHIQ